MIKINALQKIYRTNEIETIALDQYTGCYCQPGKVDKSGVSTHLKILVPFRNSTTGTKKSETAFAIPLFPI